MNRNLTTYKSSNSNACKGVLAYRFSFNGMEKTDIDQGVYDFGARLYNAEIGRFFSVDPLFFDFPFMSSYCFAANNSIMLIDFNGEGPFLVNSKDGNKKQLVFQIVLYPEPGMSSQDMKDAVSRAYRAAHNQNSFKVGGKVDKDVSFGSAKIDEVLVIDVIMLDSKDAADEHFKKMEASGTLVKYNYFEVRDKPDNGTANTSGNTGYINSGAFTSFARATNILTDEMLHAGGADWEIEGESPGSGHYCQKVDGAEETSWGTQLGSTSTLTKGMNRDFEAMKKGSDKLRPEAGLPTSNTQFGVPSKKLVDSEK